MTSLGGAALGHELGPNGAATLQIRVIRGIQSKSFIGDIYKLGIVEAARLCDVRAGRLDDQLFGEGMMERTYRRIDIADINIADLSTRNANVFNERCDLFGKYWNILHQIGQMRSMRMLVSTCG